MSQELTLFVGMFTTLLAIINPLEALPVYLKLLEGKGEDEFPSVVASTWLELLYDVVKAEKTTPPAASRIYGITEVYLRTAFGC